MVPLVSVSSPGRRRRKSELRASSKQEGQRQVIETSHADESRQELGLELGFVLLVERVAGRGVRGCVAVDNGLELGFGQGAAITVSNASGDQPAEKAPKSFVSFLTVNQVALGVEQIESEGFCHGGKARVLLGFRKVCGTDCRRRRSPLAQETACPAIEPRARGS